MFAEREDFDFNSWLAKSRPPFRDCVRSAADSLALGRGRLRDRLVVALFCLGSSDGRDVPEELRPTLSRSARSCDGRPAREHPRSRAVEGLVGALQIPQPISSRETS